MRLTDGWLFTPRMDEKDRTKIVVEKTEIVRCNNCKYWAACESEENDCDYYGVCSQINRLTYYDWFCADGEVGTYADD